MWVARVVPVLNPQILSRIFEGFLGAFRGYIEAAEGIAAPTFVNGIVNIIRVILVDHLHLSVVALVFLATRDEEKR